MRVTIYGNKLEVVCAPGEMYRTESAWWYALKKELNETHGYDLIKKIMAKDGHMYGDEHGPYYLRDRKGRFCFYDTQYAVRAINTVDVATVWLHQLR
jgi:hypothetical protein